MMEFEKQGFGYRLGRRAGLVINWVRWRVWLLSMYPEDIQVVMAKLAALRAELEQSDAALRRVNGDYMEARYEADKLRAELDEARRVIASIREQFSAAIRPVRVRFRVTPENLWSEYIENEKTGPEVMKDILTYLSARAVIDLPADVPSAEVLADIVSDAFGDFAGDWDDIAKAILAHLAPWLQWGGVNVGEELTTEGHGNARKEEEGS